MKRWPGRDDVVPASVQHVFAPNRTCGCPVRVERVRRLDASGVLEDFRAVRLDDASAGTLPLRGTVASKGRGLLTLRFGIGRAVVRPASRETR